MLTFFIIKKSAFRLIYNILRYKESVFLHFGKGESKVI